MSSASTSDGKFLSSVTFLLSCCINTVRHVLHSDRKLLPVVCRGELEAQEKIVKEQVMLRNLVEPDFSSSSSLGAVL